MSGYRLLACALASCLLMGQLPAQDAAMEVMEAGATMPDEIVLEGGTKLIGTIIHMQEGVLLFETSDTSNTIEIDFSKVQSIQSGRNHLFVLKDGGSSAGTSSSGGARQAQIMSDSQGAVQVSLDDVTAIDPPAESTASHRGSMVATSTIEDGNAKAKEVQVLADYEVRFEQRRLTLRGEWNYEEDAGKVSARDAEAFAKYDYFFSEKVFFYGTAAAAGDDFDDINLRTDVGVGLGYQLYDTDRFELYAETGVSFVNEDFISISDERRVAQRFSGKLDYDIFSDLRFFHIVECFLSWESERDVEFATQTGLRASLTDNLFATAQVNWDYDGSPLGTEQRKDAEYIFGLGYSFDF